MWGWIVCGSIRIRNQTTVLSHGDWGKLRFIVLHEIHHVGDILVLSISLAASLSTFNMITVGCTLHKVTWCIVYKSLAAQAGGCNFSRYLFTLIYNLWYFSVSSNSSPWLNKAQTSTTDGKCCARKSCTKPASLIRIEEKREIWGQDYKRCRLCRLERRLDPQADKAWRSPGNIQGATKVL